MNLKYVIAVTAVAALPALALAQPTVPKPTNADAQKVVAIIKGDKAKTRDFCELGVINDEMAEAEEKKDNKKLDALSKQADQLAEEIGPEYVKLMDGLDQVDQNSPLGKEIAATLNQLAGLCGGR
jgi:hypothetical protein